MEVLVLIHLWSGGQQMYRSFLGPPVILVLACWSSLVSFHRSASSLQHCAQVAGYIWSSQWLRLIWLVLKLDWNTWSPETHPKLVGATEERADRSRRLLLSRA